MTIENTNPTPADKASAAYDEGLAAFEAEIESVTDDDDVTYDVIPDDNDEEEDLDEIVANDEEDEIVDEADDDAFGFDDVDLSFVPKELRRDTLAETLKAVKEDQEAKAKVNEERDKELASVKEMLQEKPEDYVAQYQNNLQSLDAEIAKNTKDAKAYLQHMVDTNQMSEADANLQYGEYKAECKAAKEKFKEEAYSATNLAIVENFVKSNEELLKNPTIAQAAEVFLKDIIGDGNMVNTQRSTQYLNIGKQIWDEAYKAGLSASKQTAEKQKIEATKKKVSNPQVTKGQSSPQKRGIPYASSADVPQKVWDNDPAIRSYFLAKDAKLLK